MEIIYRAVTKTTNIVSKPVEPKTKVMSVIKIFIRFKSFYDPSKLKHIQKRIYFALEIARNKITKSILHKLKLFDYSKNKWKKNSKSDMVNLQICEILVIVKFV